RVAGAFTVEFKRIEENQDVPFPDEDSIKVPIPGEWIRTVPLDTDLGALSEEGAECDVSLLRIVFPAGLKPVIVPIGLVPDKLLECSALKIRSFVRKEANKDFMYNKLVYAFSGKETQLKEALTETLTRPYDAIGELKRADSDFSFSFWSHLLASIKKDLEKKGEKTAEDLAIYQAAFICEFYANHFKAKAQRVVDREAAFKSLDASFRKAPHQFSLDDILAFSDSKGIPLLGKFSREELDERLRELSAHPEPGMLPDLLVLPSQGRKVYVPKEKALFLALRLIGDARTELRTLLLEQWKKVLAEYRQIPPMRDDEEFLKELQSLVQSHFPLLHALLADNLLGAIALEMEGRGEIPADVEGLLDRGELVGLCQLLDLRRSALLTDARMLLPFWYSVSVLAFFAKLFKKLGGAGKGQRKPRERRETAKLAATTAATPAATAEKNAASAASKGPGKQEKSPQDRRAEFAAAATKVARELVPAGQGLDACLVDLEGRWNTLLNAQAKANLTEDVNSLVRDYLRSIVRNMGGSSFTSDRVKNLASTLAGTASLSKIKNRQALELYLQLYMAKSLGARLSPST
ncbi:MAG: hypothetical protein Q8M76_18545, partial [Spirochaetaceae bacterium]|nr:hypothetical protein [Spirochaetaceae bacterium]